MKVLVGVAVAPIMAAGAARAATISIADASGSCAASPASARSRYDTITFFDRSPDKRGDGSELDAFAFAFAVSATAAVPLPISAPARGGLRHAGHGPPQDRGATPPPALVGIVSAAIRRRTTIR